MALQYSTKGFVYKRKNRGEADRIFTVFTYDFGKIDIWARGIRKINSKLKSGIDIFYLTNIEFVQGKKKTLTDAVIINKFKNIASVPEKFEIAKKISKILDSFIKGETHDHEIFNLLEETFNKINEIQILSPRHCEEPAGDVAIPFFKIASRSPLGSARNDGMDKLKLIYLVFFWNFVSILGYKPELFKCVICNGQLKENNLYFSYKESGAICETCFNSKKNAIKTKSDTIKILRLILKQSWDTILKLKISPEIQKELNNISKNYYLYLLSSHEHIQK